MPQPSERAHGEIQGLFKHAPKLVPEKLEGSTLESQRLATDPNLLASLNRKSAIASHNLLKADTEAAGEDFDASVLGTGLLRRARDGTAARRRRHIEMIKLFQDYRQIAGKFIATNGFEAGYGSLRKGEDGAVERACCSGGLEMSRQTTGASSGR